MNFRSQLVICVGWKITIDKYSVGIAVGVHVCCLAFTKLVSAGTALRQGMEWKGREKYCRYLIYSDASA